MANAFMFVCVLRFAVTVAVGMNASHSVAAIDKAEGSGLLRREALVQERGKNPVFNIGERVMFKYTKPKIHVEYLGNRGVRAFDNRLLQKAFDFVKRNSLAMTVEEQEENVEDGVRTWTYCLQAEQTVAELQDMGLVVEVVGNAKDHPSLCMFEEGEILLARLKNAALNIERRTCPSQCHGYMIPRRLVNYRELSTGHTIPKLLRQGETQYQCRGAGVPKEHIGGCQDDPCDFTTVSGQSVRDCHCIKCLGYTGDREPQQYKAEKRRVSGERKSYTYGEFREHFKGHRGVDEWNKATPDWPED